jgi:hypothetical protein
VQVTAVVRGALDRLARSHVREAMYPLMGRLVTSWWDRMLQLALLVTAPTAQGLQQCLAAFRQALGGTTDAAACLHSSVQEFLAPKAGGTANAALNKFFLFAAELHVDDYVPTCLFKAAAASTCDGSCSSIMTNCSMDSRGDVQPMVHLTKAARVAKQAVKSTLAHLVREQSAQESRFVCPGASIALACITDERQLCKQDVLIPRHPNKIPGLFVLAERQAAPDAAKWDMRTVCVVRLAADGNSHCYDSRHRSTWLPLVWTVPGCASSWTLFHATLKMTAHRCTQSCRLISVFWRQACLV